MLSLPVLSLLVSLTHWPSVRGTEPLPVRMIRCDDVSVVGVGVDLI